jgi:hypothetical protein
MKIEKNENKIDRIIRFLLALIFFSLATSSFEGVIQIIFYILSAVMLFTAATGFCGLYKLLNINTNKK